MLLKEDLPRGVWKLAKITELISSNDGKIRAAKVLLLTKKVLNRPLLAWECRGVSAENWKLARRPGLKARLGYSVKNWDWKKKTWLKRTLIQICSISCSVNKTFLVFASLATHGVRVYLNPSIHTEVIDREVCTPSGVKIKISLLQAKATCKKKKTRVKSLAGSAYSVCFLSRFEFRLVHPKIKFSSRYFG